MSAQIIDAFRKRADVLEADAEQFRNDREVAWKYVQTVGAEQQITPTLLRFVATELRALADEAEGKAPE